MVTQNKYISQTKVPWSGVDGSEILAIGEAPGYEEDRDKIPFVGEAGKTLDSLLGKIGITRSDIKVGNVCNYRPASNDFDYLRDTSQLAEGIKEANDYIEKYKDRIKLVILLGKEPLRYIGGKPPKASISKWRGSFLQQKGVVFGITNHPSALSYSSDLYPTVSNDFKRFREVLNNGYKKPIHDFVIDPKSFELELALKEIENAPIKAFDIETSKKNPKRVICLGVSISSTRAFCFYNKAPFMGGLESGFADICERLFNSSGIHAWHNGYIFDREVLYLNGKSDIRIDYDTFIAAHSLEPELPRTLAYLGSVYTWEPYWKDMWGEEDDSKSVNEEKITKEQLMEYNCIDTIVTYQVRTEQLKDFINERACKETSDFEHQQLVPLFTHINRSGMLIDKDRQSILRAAITKSRDEHQKTLNAIAGKEINVNGRLALPVLLYEEWKLPIQKKKRKDGKTTVTTDEDAVVKLIGIAKEKAESYKTPDMRFEWEKKVAGLKLILLIRGEEKLLSNYIDFEFHHDGRVRSSYGIGPETGRANCSMYVDNTGLNAQTFPREAFQV